MEGIIRVAVQDKVGWLVSHHNDDSLINSVDIQSNSMKQLKLTLAQFEALIPTISNSLQARNAHF